MPSRSRKGGPGVGISDVDTHILETLRRRRAFPSPPSSFHHPSHACSALRWLLPRYTFLSLPFYHSFPNCVFLNDRLLFYSCRRKSTLNTGVCAISDREQLVARAHFRRTLKLRTATTRVAHSSIRGHTNGISTSSRSFARIASNSSYRRQNSRSCLSMGLWEDDLDREV